jgi:hypothetical protein
MLQASVLERERGGETATERRHYLLCTARTDKGEREKSE